MHQDGVSDAERNLLRKSVRDLLSNNWPADRAVENSGNAEAIAKLWQAMARQGLASLGTDAAGVGLREVILVFEELGRASCPAPLLGAVAANLALATQTSNAARAALASEASGQRGDSMVRAPDTRPEPGSSARALLEDLHQGDAIIALALGTFDGDPAAGRVAVHDDTLRGKVSFVEGVQTATHHLVFTAAPAGVAVVAADAHGLTMRATPGLAVPPFCELIFEDAPALRLAMPSEALTDVAVVARLACAGRALGAAQRGFDLAVGHVKVRKQFGQLVGQFQAVQHKLANCLISLDGARLALETAAMARDSDYPDWRVFASSALAFAGPALRTVSIETHRTLGAIGYAEEHEAPRHFRRVHADLARFGGAPRARAELADFLLGPVQ